MVYRPWPRSLSHLISVVSLESSGCPSQTRMRRLSKGGVPQPEPWLPAARSSAFSTEPLNESEEPLLRYLKCPDSHWELLLFSLSLYNDGGTCMCAKLDQVCLTLCNPTDCSRPGSSVHGILWARILVWVVMPSSKESSLPRDQTHVSHVSCIGSQVLCH